MRKITPTEPRKIAFLSRDTVAWPGLSSLCRADWNLHQLFTLLIHFGPNMVKKLADLHFSLLRDSRISSGTTTTNYPQNSFSPFSCVDVKFR